MAVEVEAKMAVPELEPVRERLRQLGAEPVGTVLETNTFFDNAGRTLLAGDSGLRLRRNRYIETGREEHIITWKGPRQPGPLKTREEVEVIVLDSDDATQLLERIGFVRMLTFEKRRETWKLGGCKVELDELPYLGCFVEIEGHAEAPVMAVREQLGLGGHAIVKKGYASLLTDHLQKRGDSSRTVSFADV